MKQILSAVILSLALLPIACPAQEQPAQRSPDTVVAAMSAKLNLTDDQRAAITPIVADRQQKLLALRGESVERPHRTMRDAKGILEHSDKQINAVLTPDQRKRYKQMEDERIAQMRANRRSRGGDSVL